MLRANVNLSRKILDDCNSTGFGVSLEGEIYANPDDPQAVIERVRELFDLAEEALDLQVERHRSVSAIASRDVPRPTRTGHAAGQPAPAAEARPAPELDSDAPRNGHQETQPNGAGESASNKQVQYLHTLAKRRKLFGAKLDGLIEDVVGRPCGPYDLTKKEAGTVIDALNTEWAGRNARG